MRGPAAFLPVLRYVSWTRPSPRVHEDVGLTASSTLVVALAGSPIKAVPTKAFHRRRCFERQPGSWEAVSESLHHLSRLRSAGALQHLHGSLRAEPVGRI